MLHLHYIGNMKPASQFLQYLLSCFFWQNLWRQFVGRSNLPINDPNTSYILEFSFANNFYLFCLMHDIIFAEQMIKNIRTQLRKSLKMCCEGQIFFIPRYTLVIIILCAMRFFIQITDYEIEYAMINMSNICNYYLFTCNN